MSHPDPTPEPAPSPARTAAVALGVPLVALSALLALALGPHANMIMGAAHTMMRAVTDVVLGGNGVGMQ